MEAGRTDYPVEVERADRSEGVLVHGLDIGFLEVDEEPRDQHGRYSALVVGSWVLCQYHTARMDYAAYGSVRIGISLALLEV